MARIPPELAAALLPFQTEGVRFALQRRGRCLLADEARPRARGLAAAL